MVLRNLVLDCRRDLDTSFHNPLPENLSSVEGNLVIEQETEMAAIQGSLFEGLERRVVREICSVHVGVCFDLVVVIEQSVRATEVDVCFEDSLTGAADHVAIFIDRMCAVTTVHCGNNGAGG